MTDSKPYAVLMADGPNAGMSCRAADEDGEAYICGGYAQLVDEAAGWKARALELRAALMQAIEIIDKTADIAGGNYPAFRSEYDAVYSKLEGGPT